MTTTHHIKDTSIEWPFNTTDPKQLTMLRAVAERAAYADIIRGLVHELRNPMQSMMIAAQALIDDDGQGNGKTLLDVILRGSDQSAVSIDLLGEVIGERSHSEGPVLLQDVIQWAKRCQQVSRFQINGPIKLQLPPDIPAVAADERDIGTVLTLVLNNAKESIGADCRGSISITANCRDNDQGVVIAIEDNGSGMAQEECEDAFEPYHTTKSSEHVGIGLTAARALLACYNGRIRLNACHETGIRCELWIPKWSRLSA